MTYVNKDRTVLQTRRISISFRDKCLLPIYEAALNIIKEFEKMIESSDSTID